MKKIVFVISVLALCACDKYYIPEPDDHHYTGPAANTTISQLDTYWQNHGNGIITDDIIIKCVVAGNDMENNIERQLYVQDSTGGCVLLIDAPYLYRHYIIGQELYLHCRNMCLKENEQGLQLGMYRYYIDSALVLFEGLYEQECPQYVFLSHNVYDIAPYEMYSMEDFTGHLNTLVRIPQVVFGNGGTASFLDTTGSVTYHSLRVGNEWLWMRISPLAWFSSDILPSDTCTVTGLLTVENGLQCIQPRSRADIKSLQK